MPKQNSEISKQLQRLRHQKNILWVGVLLFVLVVVWILMSIFTSSRTSSITPEQRELAKPFVPRLESAVFDQILTRRPYDVGELALFSVFVADRESISEELILFDITGQLQQQSDDEAQTELADDGQQPADEATESADFESAESSPSAVNDSDID
jgi:hypothetical protein